MLSRVIAKNVWDVFLGHTVYRGKEWTGKGTMGGGKKGKEKGTGSYLAVIFKSWRLCYRPNYTLYNTIQYKKNL